MQQRGSEERKTGFKILTAEVVSLRFISYPKEKAAMNAQEGVHGTTSGGYTSKVGGREAGMEAEASCFVISLKKKQDMADRVYRP